MRTSKKTKSDSVHEILKENGLKIAGWETINCGFGIEFEKPVIVDSKTDEPINLFPEVEV